MKHISLLFITASLLLSGNVYAQKTTPVIESTEQNAHTVKSAAKKYKAKHKKIAPCDPKPEVVTCSMPKP